MVNSRFGEKKKKCLRSKLSRNIFQLINKEQDFPSEGKDRKVPLRPRS